MSVAVMQVASQRKKSGIKYPKVRILNLGGQRIYRIGRIGRLRSKSIDGLLSERASQSYIADFAFLGVVSTVTLLLPSSLDAVLNCGFVCELTA